MTAKIVRLNKTEYDSFTWHDDHNPGAEPPGPNSWAIVDSRFVGNVGAQCRGSRESTIVDARGESWPAWACTDTRAGAAQELTEATADNWNGGVV